MSDSTPTPVEVPIPQPGLYLTPDPPRHIAVVNHSKLAADTDVAFWVEAASQQMRRDFAPCWGILPPGIAFYGSMAALPANQAAIVGIADDDGNADSAGYHVDIGGLIYSIIDMGQSKFPSRTLTHEIPEMCGNPHLSRKIPGPRNRLYYVEVSDPVQDRQYEMEVEILGEKRLIPVSDFVLPAWFGLSNPPGVNPRQTSFMEGLGDVQPIEPFEVAEGGYQIAETPDGEVLFLSAGKFLMNRSAHGRTRRILNRKFAAA